jgi:ribose-phosphate pyrophosphokinase
MAEKASLVIGPAALHLGDAIASNLGVRPFNLEHKVFPDGESYFRFREKPMETAILVQGTHPPQDQHIQQLLLMAAGLEAAGAKRIIAVIPYLAYARQDRAFLEGEVVSLSILLRMMKTAGIGELITVNPHAPWALASGPIAVESISSAPLLAASIVEKRLGGRYIISPGKKGMELASEIAEIVGAAPVRAESRRDPYTGEVEVIVDGGALFDGVDVIVVDDVVSTGATMSRLITHLKSRGARRILSCCIHGLFVEGADEKILKAGANHIMATNTVPCKYSEVDVSPLIAQSLSKMIG